MHVIDAPRVRLENEPAPCGIRVRKSAWTVRHVGLQIKRALKYA